MGSTFQGLSLAASGLFAARRGIEVTGHNVANANTPGYSRQRLELGANPGGALGIHTGTLMQGGGVEVLQQQRVVDQFIINRVNTETSQLGYATSLQQAYARVEQAFDEPGERGLASQLEQFWSAWDAVAATPEDEAARRALLQRADAITGSFSEISRQLGMITDDALQRADAITAEVNSAAAQIAELNLAIQAANGSTTPANDLLDQRDLLVQQLSRAVDVRTVLHEDGQMDVSVGGIALVQGRRSAEVTLDASIPGAAVLVSATTGATIAVRGGDVAGLLETANGVVPRSQAQVDALAVQLRDTVNARHALGQDLDGNPAGGFFAGTDATTLSLDPAVAGQPRAVAAAVAGAGSFDGENALRMAELAGLDAGPDDAYRTLVAGLGVDARNANQRLELQTEVVNHIQQDRDEVSGVSIDEEMTHMIAFQQAYQASARVISAVDEMLTTLIQMV